MRITDSQFRRMIIEETRAALNESTKSRKRSLASLIFEDKIGIDISKGPSDAIAYLNGPGADKRVRTLLQAGTEDGNADDEAAKITEGSATIGGLVPTQVEIELTKSIGYPLAKFDSLKKMISGGVQKIGPEGNDKIVTSGNLIIDGHHRWSSLFSVAGPDGLIASINVELPEKDAASVLAIVQTAIASTLDGPVPKAKAGGMNILGKSENEIADLILKAYESGSGEAGPILTDEFVLQCMKDKVVKKHFGIPDQLASVAGSFGDMKDAIKRTASKEKQAESFGYSSNILEARGSRARRALEICRGIIINKVANNLSQMKQPAEGSPPRVDMPQLDKAGGGVMGPLNNLAAGKVNYKEPFKKESVSNEGDIIVERWQKLAGLIRD